MIARKVGPPPRTDLVGETIGEWSVLERVLDRGRWKWKCRCKCGEIKLLFDGAIRTGKTSRCRPCADEERRGVVGRMSRRTDLSGRTFGSWTVIRDIGRRGTMRRYECRCRCGAVRPVNASSLFTGRSVRCKGCGEAARRAGGIRALWLRTVSCAMDRGIDVSIDEAFVVELFARQCGRCALSGVELTIPERARELYDKTLPKPTASLDRIDSGSGYAEGNVQWVHKDINRMKMALGQERFIAMCRAVADNTRLREA